MQQELGPPILTRYERTQVLGVRIRQLSQGAPTSLEIDPDQQYTLQQIAQMELEQKCMPVRIIRKIGKTRVVLDTNSLELLDN